MSGSQSWGGLGRERLPGEAVGRAGGFGPCGWPLPGARVGLPETRLHPRVSRNDFPPSFSQPVAWDLSPALLGRPRFFREEDSIVFPAPLHQPWPLGVPRLPAPGQEPFRMRHSAGSAGGVPRQGLGVSSEQASETSHYFRLQSILMHRGERGPPLAPKS